MKIRIGFVSNSSTCSFIIYGFKLPDEKNKLDMIQKLLEKTKEDIVAEMKICSYYKNLKREIDDGDIDEFCYELLQGLDFEKNGFDVEFGEGIDGIIIGKHLAKISSEEDFIDNAEYGIDDIQKIADKVKEKLEISDDIPLKIYMGTQCC